MINLEYLPQTSSPIYELELPEEPERTVWDYIQDAFQVGLFFAAGMCTGTMLSVLYVLAGR